MKANIFERLPAMMHLISIFNSFFIKKTKPETLMGRRNILQLFTKLSILS
jgi:hypothetical protein